MERNGEEGDSDNEALRFRFFFSPVFRFLRLLYSLLRREG